MYSYVSYDYAKRLNMTDIYMDRKKYRPTCHTGTLCLVFLNSEAYQLVIPAENFFAGGIDNALS